MTTFKQYATDRREEDTPFGDVARDIHADSSAPDDYKALRDHIRAREGTDRVLELLASLHRLYRS